MSLIDLLQQYPIETPGYVGLIFVLLWPLLNHGANNWRVL
jgi:hypothetical protein